MDEAETPDADWPRDRAKLVLHVVVSALIVSTAFLPVSWLRRGLFVVPFVVALTWVAWDGCVLNQKKTCAGGTRRYDDFHMLLNRSGVPIHKRTARFVIYAVIVLLPTIMLARVLWGHHHRPPPG